MTGTVQCRNVAELLQAMRDGAEKLEINRDLSPEAAGLIAEELKGNSSLRELILNTTDVKSAVLGDAGAQALADALKSNLYLHRLTLHWQNIGTTGIRALAEALKSNCHLRALSFSGNLFTSDGVEALAEALVSNTHLLELSFLGCSVGDAGANTLARGLKNNKGLRKLSIAFDFFGLGGAGALAEAVKENEHLLELECGALGPEIAAEVQVYLERNRRRRMLLTIREEGDKVCCFAMSGRAIGPPLDSSSTDDVNIADWCQQMADSVGLPVDRLDFVGPSNSNIDMSPGLTVRQALQGLPAADQTEPSTGSVRDQLDA